MALPDSWHIKARAHECASTGRPFEEDEPFFTALFPDPHSAGYLRKDYSEEAWRTRSQDDEKPFSFWRTTYKPPVQEKAVEIVDKENPERLLARLVEEDEPHTENARYILAVMLERKRILVETDSQATNSGLLRIYEHRRSGEVFIIKDPQIPLTGIGPLQEEVQALLDPKEPPEGPSGPREREPSEHPADRDHESGPDEQARHAPQETLDDHRPRD